MENRLELHRSAKERLQSQCADMEKQTIQDIMNEYESRLQEAFYDQME